jgi:hypothetical protein
LLAPGKKSGRMETASSISRRQPQTEVTPNRGIRSSSAGGFSASTPASGGHGPDAVRAGLCRFPARTSSGDGGSRSLATRNRLIANLRRLRSNAEDATATTAAAVAETAAAAVAAGGGVDLASSKQFSAIGGKRDYPSPTAARRLHRRVRLPSGQSFSARPPSTTSSPSKFRRFRRETVPSSSPLPLLSSSSEGNEAKGARRLGGSTRGRRERGTGARHRHGQHLDRYSGCDVGRGPAGSGRVGLSRSPLATRGRHPLLRRAHEGGSMLTATTTPVLSP